MVNLRGKRVAILVDDYVEESQFTGPLEALRTAGAQVDIVSADHRKIHRVRHDIEPAGTINADVSIDDIRVDEYDALVLPGGTINSDRLRLNLKARIWVRKFMDMGKPIGALCQAPWTLASAGVTRGKHLTSFPSLQDDLKNAGADWLDQAVVVDNNLITGRRSADIPAFDDALLNLLAAA